MSDTALIVLAPEWSIPAHEEVDLATLNPEDYDPFNEFDAQLIDAIGAAKSKSVNPLLQAALACVARGWFVFALVERGKTPDSEFSPHGFQSSTNDPELVRQIWTKKPNANYGIDLGRSNLTVLDFDNGRPPAELNLPASLQVSTSRGTHVYFNGTSKQGKMKFKGESIGDIKSTGGYVLGPQSVHPNGPIYTVIADAPIAAVPSLDTLRPASTPVDISVRGPKIPRGQHDDTLTKMARKMRGLGWEHDAIYNALVEIVEKRCENYGSDYLEMCEKHAKRVCEKFEPGDDKSVWLTSQSIVPVVSSSALAPVSDDVDVIPEFDPSVVNGIYKKFVDVATRGTTMAPQFVYAIAKTVVGARMAGKVKFENLDVEPRFYTALIGETGSGKGEAWRRVHQILNVEGQVGIIAGLKIIHSADSGAGIRDTFFEPPEDAPMLMYIDEVESFGNKAAATRNPAILDMLIELADSTQISRVKAAKSKSSANKTKNDARLSAVMCGQDGHVYMKSFAGRTKLGMWDRLYPEYSVPVEAGDLPPIPTPAAYELLTELLKLDYSGTMTMHPEAKSRLDSFWASQPDDVRKKARWKKNLTLDVYMSALGRGLKVAESEDVEIAIKIFTRQLVIRQTHFVSEVPDRIGYYIGMMKAITAKMERRLADGVPPHYVAKSRRDFEKETHAHRDNESHIFSRAWDNYAPTWLASFQVEKANGQKYLKYLPATDD